ncbi:MAG: cobalamin-dependent protein [Rhodospirillaceae bacterium]
MLSTLEIITAEYNAALFDTDREQALRTARRALDEGLTAEDVVFKLVIPGIELMMKAISEDFDANLAQHFMTAQIAAQVTEEMLPLFKTPPEIIGRVVIGTAKGDLHSLGKRIVIGCLRSMMVEAIDLGVNVPAERFVREAVARDAQVIGISAMMMHTADGPDGCRAVRALLDKEGLRDRIKIAVGGAPFRFSPDLYSAVGADAWAADGVTAGRVIADLIRSVRPAREVRS